jgi:predicted DCC family thiol-disulfide oxidoreductase YuxK
MESPTLTRTKVELPPQAEAIVLFDGVCNLCNASVNFVIDRDRPGRIAFASLQSTSGQALLAEHGLPTSDFDTMVLIEKGRPYTRSTAALRVMRKMRMPWPLLYPLILVPPLLRNPFYNFVARRRYRWFGKQEACRIPTPELRQRFLE